MTGKYVIRGGEQTFAPPFLQKDTRLTGFVLPADSGALQATCDRLLNEPSGGAVSYRPLGGHVLLAYAPIGSTQATEPPDHDKGYTPETDIAFWMLVGAGEERGGEWELQRLAWLLPYVWVDVPTTMATGREVYGYPKEVGWITTPRSEREELVFGLETLVLPTYTPETALVRRPMLQVDRVRHSDAEPEAWGSALDAVRDLWDVLSDSDTDVSWELLEQLAEMLWRREVPMVFLKQFRDLVDPSQACYQAILESPAQVQGLPVGWPLLHEHRVTIHDWASHPVAGDLGLGTPEDGVLTLTPSLSFEVRFDFLAPLGEVIWQAGR